MSQSALPRDWQVALDLQDALRSAEFAELGCLSTSLLCRRATKLPIDPMSTALTSVIAERTLTRANVRAIVDGVVRMIDQCEQLPSADRPKVDSAIRRLLRVLPPPDAHKIAVTQLSHKRKSRRAIAIRLLRNAPVSAETGTTLRKAYETSKDEEMLHLIARSRAAVVATDVLWLLSRITEDYWRMRVLQELMACSPRRAEGFAAGYPMEFAWAAGRLGHVRWRKVLRELGTASDATAPTCRMVVWYFGKIRATADVKAMVEIIQSKCAALSLEVRRLTMTVSSSGSARGRGWS